MRKLRFIRCCDKEAVPDCHEYMQIVQVSAIHAHTLDIYLWGYVDALV